MKTYRFHDSFFLSPVKTIEQGVKPIRKTKNKKTNTATFFTSHKKNQKNGEALSQFSLIVIIFMPCRLSRTQLMVGSISAVMAIFCLRLTD